MDKSEIEYQEKTKLVAFLALSYKIPLQSQKNEKFSVERHFWSWKLSNKTLTKNNKPVLWPKIF